MSSGIRSIFGYCPTPRIDSYQPLEFSDNMLEPWVIETLEVLAQKAPYGENGRVQLGVAYDEWFSPQEMTLSFFDKIRSLGIKHVTAHCAKGPALPLPVVELMHSLGLLDQTVLISHANGANKKEAELMTKADVYFSSTPSTELQMALGAPTAFDENVPELRPFASLGIDCHSNNSASIVGEMRLLLQSARGFKNQKLIDGGLIPRTLHQRVEEVFNMGTIQGARAIHMSDQLGSIQEGKIADLVLFDTMSPSMLAAAQENPVAAIVMHSSIRDVQDVIVDGKLRKRNGALVPVQAYGSEAKSIIGKESLSWEAVAKELLNSREVLKEKMNKIDYDAVLKGLKERFQIAESVVVDE